MPLASVQCPQSRNYSEPLIIQSQILHFSRIYTLFPWSQPNAHNNNVELWRILHFLNFTFSPHFIFLVPITKIYTILSFVVQFSKLLIQDNRPPSLSAVINNSVSKYVSNGWCMAASDLCSHHVTSLWPSVHKQIFPPPQSKELARAMPALNLIRLSTIVLSHTRQVHHSDHCVFISETFNRNAPRLN